MEMKMTDRDKKLLRGLLVFVVIAVLGWWGIRPLYASCAAYEEQIEAASQEKLENEEKMMLLSGAEMQNQSLKEQLEKEQQDFYRLMPSQEIDRLFTGMALDAGLFVRSLNIGSIEADMALKPYAGSSVDSSAQPENLTGVYRASVGLSVSGSREVLEDFLDSLSLDYPAIRLTAVEWETVRERESEAEIENPVLKLNMELYMCQPEA